MAYMLHFILHVWKESWCRKKTLCVCCQGSGRVADILADAYCDSRNVHQDVENGFV